MGTSLLWPKIYVKNTYKAPATEDKRTIIGNVSQPNHPPNADNSLKSPNPIPSFPVTNLNIQ